MGHGKDEAEASHSQQGAGLGANASLAQMVSGLVGQLLMQPVLEGESLLFPAPNLEDFHGSEGLPSLPDVLLGVSQFSLSPFVLAFLLDDRSGDFNLLLLVPIAQGSPGMAAPPAPATASASAGTTNTATTAGPAPGGPTQPPPPQPSTSDLQFSQLLGNLLGPAGPGSGGPGVAPPSITVAMPGVPAFLQGVTDFLQVSGQLTRRPSCPCLARHCFPVATTLPQPQCLVTCP